MNLYEWKTDALKQTKGDVLKHKILRDNQKGYKRSEIAKRCNITLKHYDYLAKMMREEGLLRKCNTQTNNEAKMIDALGKDIAARTGDMKDVFEGTDAELLKWVKYQMNEFSGYLTLAEFLRELLIEEYYRSKK